MPAKSRKGQVQPRGADRNPRGAGRKNGRPQTRVPGVQYQPHGGNVIQYRMRKDAPDPYPGRCTATARSSGERCKMNATFGTHVCKVHGGRSPNTIEAVYQRLRATAPLALQVLIDLMMGAEDERVRLGAARDLLDRAGIVKHIAVDASVNGFEARVVNIIRAAAEPDRIEDIEDAELDEEEEV
jgi:hypothetical protein